MWRQIALCALGLLRTYTCCLDAHSPPLAFSSLFCQSSRCLIWLRALCEQDGPGNGKSATPRSHPLPPLHLEGSCKISISGLQYRTLRSGAREGDEHLGSETLPGETTASVALRCFFVKIPSSFMWMMCRTGEKKKHSLAHVKNKQATQKTSSLSKRRVPILHTSYYLLILLFIQTLRIHFCGYRSTLILFVCSPHVYMNEVLYMGILVRWI